jgi:threonine dehydratase
MIPTPLDVVAARRRLREHLQPTPLHESAWLSARVGSRASLKLESIQLTGSFKIRGALNALLKIGASEDREIVTSSAGNHGRALAYAAQMLGMRAVVFTPRNAAENKVAAIRRHGARLEQVAGGYDEAEMTARRYALEQGATFVSPYNHPDVVSGGGTVALEILDAAPDVDTLIVPIGGGGLISGIAIAAKAVGPAIRVVGVEAEASAAFGISLRNGRITVIEPQPTVADGLGGNVDPETITFPIIQRCVDEVVTVSERELLDAIRGLAREEHVIAEGAGAAAVAALLAGKVRGRRRVVAVVSGANIDVARLVEILGGELTRETPATRPAPPARE